MLGGKEKYGWPVTPRARVFGLVALAATGAAGATVGVTLLTTRGEHRSAPTTTSRTRPGPPLFLDLGVRTDPEARALRRAAGLYQSGRRARAAAIFRRHRSLEAQVGAALAAWPGTLPRLERLARSHPGSGAVQLNDGFALLQSGRPQAARAAWQRAKRAEPDSMYAIEADNFLHPNLAPGLPPFVPDFPSPPELARLSPPRQLTFLAARASHGGFRDKILYGVALQNLGRPRSAERQFRAAAALAPGDPEARTAAAVGLFEKDDPALAFGRLGPLTRLFPRAATVRFHLGLLLLWIGRAEQGKRELRLTRQEAPGSRLAREAGRFLARLGGVGTNRPQR
jgi:tetratricopeptide (TPR) repeat protein